MTQPAEELSEVGGSDAKAAEEVTWSTWSIEQLRWPWGCEAYLGRADTNHCGGRTSRAAER